MVDDPDPRPTVHRAEPGEPTANGTVNGGAFAATEPGEDATTGEQTMVPTWGLGTFVALPDPGYQLGELIGRGGMGEVVVAQDQRIGREVAVKRIRSRSPSPDIVNRFLREARIQARLDHPAIVPVYELGTDADGRPYFTMKRLAGVTLAKRLSEQAPIQALLRAFVDVCLAVQFAHARGVVHRDLKPSNIMLGDYGEVYVLDWGIARVLTDRSRSTQPHQIVEELDEGTTVGAILGTPGYMAPEQVKGHDVTPKADIYALGAMLFEILSGQPLHPRGGEAALASTLSQPRVAPAVRTPERTIAPELDGVCFDALCEEPEGRPTAREIADRVQAYLDGDRDLERRRNLAHAQLAAAQEALTGSGDDARATAMRRAGRALALDPESEPAASLVSALLLEPPAPESTPPDLVHYLATEERDFTRSRSRLAMWTYLTLFGFWLVIPFMDIKNWTSLLTVYGLIALGALSAWRSSQVGVTSVPVTLVITTFMVLAFTRVTGPFILTPVVACAILMQLSAIPAFSDRRGLIVGWTVAAVMLPFVLEWTHLIQQTYLVEGGYVVTQSDIFGMRRELDEIALVSANVIFIVAAGLVTLSISRRRLAAQRQLQVQAWHLRQLIPTGARPWQTQPKRRRTMEE